MLLFNDIQDFIRTTSVNVLSFFSLWNTVTYVWWWKGRSKPMCYVIINCDLLQDLFKYCNSLHSKSFDVYLISCDLYSKRNLVIANIYFYLYNVLILRLILYDLYLRMIRCYEEKMSDFRLKTEESESSSDSYKDLNDTRERIRLLQLESEWRHQ